MPEACRKSARSTQAGCNNFESYAASHPTVTLEDLKEVTCMRDLAETTVGFAGAPRDTRCKFPRSRFCQPLSHLNEAQRLREQTKQTWDQRDQERRSVI